MHFVIAGVTTKKIAKNIVKKKAEELKWLYIHKHTHIHVYTCICTSDA